MLTTIKHSLVYTEPSQRAQRAHKNVVSTLLTLGNTVEWGTALAPADFTSDTRVADSCGGHGGMSPRRHGHGGRTTATATASGPRLRQTDHRHGDGVRTTATADGRRLRRTDHGYGSGRRPRRTDHGHGDGIRTTATADGPPPRRRRPDHRHGHDVRTTDTAMASGSRLQVRLPDHRSGPRNGPRQWSGLRYGL